MNVNETTLKTMRREHAKAMQLLRVALHCGGQNDFARMIPFLRRAADHARTWSDVIRQALNEAETTARSTT